MTLGDLIWNITANTTGINKGLKETETSAGKLGSTFKSVGNLIKTAVATAGILQFTKAVIGAAADAQELENKFSVVFGNISKDIDQWIVNYAKATARGVQDTKTFLTTLQDIRTGFGDSTKDASEFSKAVLGITNDLSSFSNVGFEETFNAIQSGLSGQFEALRRLGVGLNVAIIDQGAYAEALGKSWEKMNNLEKQEAILSGILSQSANAVGQSVGSWQEYNYALGDAANTSTSFANQMQGLRGEIKDGAADIGQIFLPTATKLVSLARTLIASFSDLSGETKEFSLELAGIAVAFATGGWIGLAIAGIAALTIEIIDSLDSTDELDEVTKDLIKTSEEYNAIVNKLADSESNLTRTERELLEIRGQQKEQELISILGELEKQYSRVTDQAQRQSDTVVQASSYVDLARETYARLSAEYAGVASRQDQVIDAAAALQEAIVNEAKETEKLLEIQSSQKESIQQLAAAYNEGTLNLDTLRETNRALYLEILDSAAGLGNYTSALASVNAMYNAGRLSSAEYARQVEELRVAAKNTADQTRVNAEAEASAAEERRAWLLEQDRLALEEAERKKELAGIAEEYRRLLFELDATEKQLTLAERNRALAAVEGNEEATAAIKAYYDAVLQGVGVVEKEEETVSKLKTIWDDYGNYIQQTADLIFQIWQQSLDAQLEAQLDSLDQREQAELEAAGVAEETEIEKAEAQLATAKESGDAIAIAEAEGNLKRLNILEKYEKERIQAQYEADLESYNLAVTQSIINGSLATLKAFADGGWVQAIIVGALAAVEVGVVAANKPKKPQFGSGGIVGGNLTSGDNIEANLDSREMVLTQAQQAELFAMANGGIRNGGQTPIIRATIIIQSDYRTATKHIVDIINNGEYLINEEGIA